MPPPPPPPPLLGQFCGTRACKSPSKKCHRLTSQTDWTDFIGPQSSFLGGPKIERKTNLRENKPDKAYGPPKWHWSGVNSNVGVSGSKSKRWNMNNRTKEKKKKNETIWIKIYFFFLENFLQTSWGTIVTLAHARVHQSWGTLECESEWLTK